MTTQNVEADDTQTSTYWILTPDEFRATETKLEKINARAAKRGFTGRLDLTGTERTITKTNDQGDKHTTVVIDTTLTGQVPCYDNWEFLAAVDTIETTAGTDFIIRTVPSVDESGLDRSTLTAGYCAHCKRKRPNRIYTYLVRNTETGQMLQVGKTCIKDFTGWDTLPVFISEDDIRDELNNFIGSLAGGRDECTPETIVAIAWAASRLYGWSGRFGPGTPTAGIVSDYLYGTNKAAKKVREEISPEMPAAHEKASEIIPALLDGLTDNSDYATNLKTALRGISVSAKHLGIVASAVIAYERMNSTQIREKLDTNKGKPETAYIGAEGDKVTMTGTVTKALAVETNYGFHPETSILLIVEDGPTVLKTFTKAAWAFDIDQGDTITVTATVKKHADYKGTKQTVVNRPKLIEKHTTTDDKETAK